MLHDNLLQKNIYIILTKDETPKYKDIKMFNDQKVSNITKSFHESPYQKKNINIYPMRG